MIIIHYLFLFYTYSIIGYFVETIYTSINQRKLVDRGFLIGPYLPIYGAGSLIMILYLTQYKNNLITVFLLGTILCSILEYLTSYIMEKLFRARWWDYSHLPFNLNGRICLKNSCLFGFCSIVVIYLLQPLINNIIPISNNIIIYVTLFISIIFIIDLITSLKVANLFKDTIKNIEFKKDSTLEFTKLVKDTLQKNNKILQKRLYMAFPSIDFSKLIEIKNNVKKDLKEIKDDIKTTIKEKLNNIDN